MKKALSLTLALVLAFALAIPAFAAAETANVSVSGSQPTVEVAYTTTEFFTVTIPADIALAKAQDANTLSGSADVEAVGLLAANKTLTVTMSTANYDEEASKFYLAYEGSKINYTIKVGAADFSEDGTVLTMAAGSESAEATLNFAAADITEATKAGKHSDTLTFTVTCA